MRLVCRQQDFAAHFPFFIFQAIISTLTHQTIIHSFPNAVCIPARNKIVPVRGFAYKPTNNHTGNLSKNYLVK